jgi:ATP-dependent Clp protease ATP-binding subunit ClpA
MDMNKLTQMSRQAVTDAQSEARRRNHNEVDTWHLLHALLGQEEGIVPALVEKLDLTTSALQTRRATRGWTDSRPLPAVSMPPKSMSPKR